jgi:hypothetical protein
MAAFVFLAIYQGTGTFYADDLRYVWFLLTALVYSLTFERKSLSRLWNEYRSLWISILAFAIAISVSEATATRYGQLPIYFIPFQTPLLLCAPFVALFFLDSSRLNLTWAVFLLIVCWHFFSLPIEGVTGVKLSWHPDYQYVRQQWGLNYQAFGFAIANPYFAGFHLPLFYLTLGAIRSKHVLKDVMLPAWSYSALATAWVISCLSVQSRSVFAGSILASLIFIFGESPRARRLALVVVPFVLVASVIVYLSFLTGKSSADMRWVYMKLYLLESLKWPYLLFGHGQLFDIKTLVVPGYQFLAHSHNDVIQIAFWWGFAALAAYLWMWFQVVKLLWTRFASRDEYWPFAVIASFLPHSQTDLGIHHYEKAILLVILVAGCVAMDFRRGTARTSRDR